MSVYFVDTSVIAKRYLQEVGSRWVRALLRPAGHHTVILAETASVEFSSLINRLIRTQKLTAAEGARFRRRFTTHARKQYSVIELDTPILARARRITIRHPLRALDSIQLACAIQARQDTGAVITFLSADADLLAAAAAESFAVDNPLLHP